MPVDTAGEGSGTGTGTGTGPSTGESSSRRKEGLNLVDMIIRFRNLHLNAFIILVWNGVSYWVRVRVRVELGLGLGFVGQRGVS